MSGRSRGRRPTMAEARMFRRRAFSIQRQPGFATMAALCFLLLYLPIAVLTVYSFNSGVSIAIWEGFSFRWYEQAWQNERVQDASIRSLIIAFFASAIATTVATLAALATTRTKPFRGQTVVYAMINKPM